MYNTSKPVNKAGSGKANDPQGPNPVDNMGLNHMAPSVPVQDCGQVVETSVNKRNA